MRYHLNFKFELNCDGLIEKITLQNMCNFLAQPNSITHLDLSGTDTTLECVSIIL